MAWDTIRRTITRMIDLEIANRRARVLNVVLPEAFQKYGDAVKRGELRELETEYSALAEIIVQSVVPDTEIGDEVEDD